MLSTDVIERLAVNAVDKALTSTDYLSPKISTDNTEPSWDGEVILYSDASNHKKENIEGKFRVQVKGTMDEELPNGKIKFPVNVIDLKNYNKTGGAVYFVVHVNPDKTTKIYYETFTNVKLAIILPTCNCQQTKTIEFLPLPDDPIDIVRIFSQFVIDCRKQYSFTSDNMLTFDIKDESITKLSFQVSCIGCNGDIEQALLSNEVYLYGSPKGNEHLQIPYKIIPREITIGKQFDFNVCANGKLFYTSYQIRTSKSVKSIFIGKSLKMHINSSDKKITVNICLPNTLSERIQDLDFLINVAMDKGFTINNTRFDLDISDSLDLSRLEQQLLFIIDIKKLFEILHVKNNIDITRLSTDDVNKLGQLITALVEKKKLSFQQDVPQIVRYVISGIQILIFAEKVAGEKNSYILKDLFNADLMFAYSTPNGFERVTIFSSLKAEDYNTFANVDYDKIVEMYSNIYAENQNLPQYANINVLELLSAYDVSNNPDQLEAARKLADWIIETDQSGCEAYLLNKLQIIKRRRKFSEDEIIKLSEIIEKPSSTEDLKLGAYILLDNGIMAKRYFEKLSNSQKEEFMKYPIYKRFGEKLLQ